MKLNRMLAIFLVLVMTLSLLVSCGVDEGTKESENNSTVQESTVEDTSDKTVEETASETEETVTNLKLPDGVDPDKYYKFVTFELPEGDPRQLVVEYMRTQAHVEWIAANDIKLKDDLGSWNVNLTYERGRTYHGMIYSNVNSSLHKFEEQIAENKGKFRSDATSWENITGVGCCSAILNAIQQVTNDVYGETANFIPNGKNTCRAIKLGDYTVKDGCIQTDEIVAENDQQVMYKSYALLDVGDVIVKRVNGAPHIRVVTEKATVVETNGRINPGRSYVKCIEQTNAFDKTRTDGVLTTWREDKLYTFTDLLDSKYLPVTLGVYETPETELPYLALNEEITPAILAKKTVVGSVSSNYPLKHVYISLYNSNGMVVEQEICSGFDDTFSVGLRSKVTNFFNDLKPGNYTFVVEAGIALGSAELCRVDFTVA